MINTVTYHDEINIKALSYLYGKEEVKLGEYRQFLVKEFGVGWTTVYNELERDGMVHLCYRLVEATPNSTAMSIPDNYRITEKGNLCYENLLKQKKEEEASKQESNKVSAWTIAGAVGAGIAALPVLIDFFKWVWKQIFG